MSEGGGGVLATVAFEEADTEAKVEKNDYGQTVSVERRDDAGDAQGNMAGNVRKYFLITFVSYKSLCGWTSTSSP